MTARLRGWWARWVAFWDEREPPRSLALARILLGLCFVYDFFHIWNMGLVVPLFGVAEVGGLSDALMRDEIPLYYRFAPGTVGAAQALHAAMALSAVSLMFGFFTRTSALVLLLAWSQFALVMPYADRGIDTLCRLVLTVLVFARSGDWLSVDAFVRTGSFWGDGAPIPAWPRRLLVLQLVLMYFSAGILKTGLTWWPMGHYAALYFALQDPAVAAWDFSYVRGQPFFLFVQLGAAGTMVYQWTYPLVLVLMYWRRHPGVGGRVAAFCNRYRLEFLWIGVGGLFHLILAFTMNLGIFPWAMLALYPVWLHPDEWRDLLRRTSPRRPRELPGPRPG